MDTKIYYAYVVMDMVEYFEERLVKEDKIKYFSKESAISESGEPLIYYVIEAEEGLIDPKWELKLKKETLSL